MRQQRQLAQRIALAIRLRLLLALRQELQQVLDVQVGQQGESASLEVEAVTE